MAKRIVPIVLILAVVGYFGHRYWTDQKAREQDRSFYGTVEAVEVVVSSQVTGRILELPVEEGSHVEAGALLVRIEDSLYQAQAEQARTGIQSARSQYAVVNANLNGVRTSLRRTRKLLRTGAATEMQLDDLQTREAGLLAQKQVIESQVAQAEAALHLAETQLGYTRIRAPLSGTLLRRDVEPGETAFPGSALMTLADLTLMKVTVYLPGPMLGKIRIDQPVDVVTDSYPGKPLTGTVETISDEAEFTPKNVQTREERVRLVYAVKVRLPNPDGILKSGMPVDATFQGNQ
jgi:HlyD family secretion protein